MAIRDFQSARQKAGIQEVLARVTEIQINFYLPWKKIFKSNFI